MAVGKVNKILVVKAFLLILSSGLFLYSNSYSATFNVKTTSEFRTALENADVNGEENTIILDAGTYKTTDDGFGTFKFSGINLTIKAKEGLTYNDVILDGANTHQVLNGHTFTIDRITVKNGKANDRGGGIYGSNVTVKNSTISGNTAYGYSGGGIYSSNVTVINSTISGNTADGSGGGGICGSKVTVKNSTISGNIADVGDYSHDRGGGGIYSAIVLTVTNSTISGNTVIGVYGCGGGISSNREYGDNEVTVTNSTISGNTADGSGGG